MRWDAGKADFGFADFVATIVVFQVAVIAGFRADQPAIPTLGQTERCHLGRTAPTKLDRTFGGATVCVMQISIITRFDRVKGRSIPAAIELTRRGAALAVPIVGAVVARFSRVRIDDPISTIPNALGGVRIATRGTTLALRVPAARAIRTCLVGLP